MHIRKVSLANNCRVSKRQKYHFKPVTILRHDFLPMKSKALFILFRKRISIFINKSSSKTAFHFPSINKMVIQLVVAISFFEKSKHKKAPVTFVLFYEKNGKRTGKRGQIYLLADLLAG